MKSIRDFIEGKIRRSENEERLTLVAEARAPDEELGAFEGELVGPGGHATFFERGMVLQSGERVLFERIERVMLQPARGGGRFVDIVFLDGRTQRIASSEAGGEVLHATLRWIGHTRLRRDIAG
jgi:hypothetical protein